MDKRKMLVTVLSGGGVAPLSPTAAMGYRARWPVYDNTYCFSDAGTTPAVNAGPVQQFNESLGVVASSELSAAGGDRPTFTDGGGGGKSYLSFNGIGNTMANAVTVDNYLSVSADTITLALTVKVGFTTAGAVLRDASSWFIMNHNVGDLLVYRFWDSAYKSIQVGFTPGTPFVVTFKHDTGKLYSKLNAGAWSAGVTAGNRGGSTALQLVGAGTGDIDFYDMALGNTVSDSNIASVHAYMMGQLGI